MLDRFFVGQRVRRTAARNEGRDKTWNGFPVPVIPTGECGTITGLNLDGGWDVLFDVTRSPHHSGEYWTVAPYIEPIPDDRVAFECFMMRVMDPRTVISVKSRDNATAK